MSKADELRDLWLANVDKEGGTALLNSIPGLTKATLDIIGIAGSLIFSHPHLLLTASCRV